jgi:hypothetical protein
VESFPNFELEKPPHAVFIGREQTQETTIILLLLFFVKTFTYLHHELQQEYRIKTPKPNFNDHL